MNDERVNTCHVGNHWFLHFPMATTFKLCLKVMRGFLSEPQSLNQPVCTHESCLHLGFHTGSAARPYLIFVIFFTLTHCETWIFYTQKCVNSWQNGLPTKQCKSPPQSKKLRIQQRITLSWNFLNLRREWQISGVWKNTIIMTFKSFKIMTFKWRQCESTRKDPQSFNHPAWNHE